MALKPGQYKIGNFVFGSQTLFRVESFDVAGYDVNIQDFQTVSSDDIRFGQDSLKPLPIQITINAFVNRPLYNVMALSPSSLALDFSSDPTVGSFAQEWRSQTERGQWGVLKPLYCGKEDGSTVMIYGRPGKLAVSKRPVNGAYHKIIAEFRRSDTFAYGDFEWFETMPKQSVREISRTSDMGDGTAWMRFLITGPANHPIIQFGTMDIDVNVNIGSNEVLEISSYPWQRRIISAPDGINFSSRLNYPYLDQIKFHPNTDIDVSWNASGTTGNSEMSVLWRDAWNVI